MKDKIIRLSDKFGHQVSILPQFLVENQLTLGEVRNTLLKPDFLFTEKEKLHFFRYAQNNNLMLKAERQLDGFVLVECLENPPREKFMDLLKTASLFTF